MKIGALLPRSTFHPLLQHDFLQGMEAYLQYRGVSTTWFTANIGFGINPEMVLQEAEKMLLQHHADVLVLYADQPAVSNIAAFAKQLNRLVLQVHNGAKYMHEWEPHPVVLSHTLNNTIQCRLTGIHAATLSKEAAVCTSFYDGGYSHNHALVQSYADNGGSVAYNFVSQYKVSDFDSEPLHHFLRTNAHVQTLLALYNGDLAHCFLQQLQTSDVTEGLQVFGSPMLLDETLTTVHGQLKIPFQVSGYVPWLSSLKNNANELLKTQFNAHTGREANLPGMHGWNTGMILEHIYNTADTHRFRAREILAALSDITLDSPRGPLHMDAATHHMIAPAWLVKTNEAFEPEVIGGTDNTAQIWQDIVHTKIHGVSSGWINTYLCA
ncbi:ABC transporter substrate-binding protein [Chitinophaga ginsengisegetis]|uniref:ABC transporter substrate-binding protein n=1 Tax=Chitinophaga ginsengisegetis TaxID=393003 RepID=UPI00341FB0F4